MSNIWTNFSSEKLIKLIGEKQLTDIEIILPVVSPEFKPNDFQKRATLGKIFESFSGADSLRDRPFRKELLNSLNPELKSNLMHAFDKSEDDDYQELVKLVINKPWEQSMEINRVCETLNIPNELVPEPVEVKPTSQLLKPLDNITKPFMQLKDYQFPVVLDSFEKLSAPLSRFMIQMPTGSGKTRVAMEIISEFINLQSKRTHIVWLTHSAELLEQAYECFLEIWSHLGKKDLEVIRLWGASKLPQSIVSNSLIFGGFQKLYSIFSDNKNAFNHFKNEVSLVVIDEAHRILAPTYNTVTKGIIGPNSHIIGLSATPGSSNKILQRSLARFFFDELVSIKTENNESVIKYLRKKKILSEVIYEPIHTEIKITPTPKQLQYFKDFFDIHPEILKKLSNENVRNIEIVKRLKKECENGSRIIFFACGIKHSKQICAFLTLLNIKAAHIDGGVSKNRRKNLIKDFVKGDLQVICNFEILSTGFDAPKTDVVLISRPTFSIVLYAQMIGRGLRGPAIGGSKTCKIIDVKDNMQGYSNEDLVYDYFQEYFIN
ncbi:MAG TPA: DEAD/DEAH box helicase [Pelagibacteraceae bacterium]|jgi:superfamily II DNA or RNA helicase|nr:DEAD/DEAH box helicase [Pelagibacteraceae bacterium]|tara:strand:- start:78 stop:1718 length:1641 start_codon:yes stop_codon:yes gene_type:complete